MEGLFFEKNTEGEEPLLMALKKEGERTTLMAVMGSCTHVVLPDTCRAGYISTIAPYCFSDNTGRDNGVKEAREALLAYGEQSGMSGSMRLITGTGIEALSLPSALEELREYAFYNCTGLKKLEVGPRLMVIHHDVFMNCWKLSGLIVKADYGRPTGLRYILARIQGAVSVEFRFNDEVQLKLYYSEYSMTYEPVFAAHMFEMRVNGGGYGTRQAFKDKVPDLAAYDEAVKKYFSLEDDRAQALISMYRLLYPVGCNESSREFYRETMKQKGDKALMLLAEEGDAEGFKGMVRQQLVTGTAVKKALEHMRLKGMSRFMLDITG